MYYLIDLYTGEILHEDKDFENFINYIKSDSYLSTMFLSCKAVVRGNDNA